MLARSICSIIHARFEFVAKTMALWLQTQEHCNKLILDPKYTSLIIYHVMAEISTIAMRASSPLEPSEGAFELTHGSACIIGWWSGLPDSLIVRRAGLLLSQQDFEWWWSVPLFQCLTVLEFSFILFDLCLLITFFNFIMNYVPIVTFWIFTYHKIWILSIMFCFIWSYWIIYF